MTASMEPAAGAPLVLVVDDDEAVASALLDILGSEFQAISVTSAEAALPVLAERDVAVMLADQRMPGMDGVELIVEARRRQPDLVAILMTAYADLDTAIVALNAARAFAFLTKPWELDDLLVVVRRAMDAHGALAHQRRTLLDVRRRELDIVQELAGASPAPLTALAFGAGPVRDRLPGAFDELLRRYADALEHAFAERIYRVDRHVSGDLAQIADRLGALRAGPRDVMDLHTTAMAQRLDLVSLEEAEAYVAEGRLLVLQLMGHLVTYYRAYAVG